MATNPALNHTLNDACSILLVDDFADGLEMYEEYLTYRGYHVVGARSGQEAVDKARRHRPDIILMDIRMPGMTGIDCLRILRSDRSFEGIPIVALTAHALDGERRQVLDAGFDDMIAKPCIPDQLAAAVDRLVATARQGGRSFGTRRVARGGL